MAAGAIANEMMIKAVTLTLRATRQAFDATRQGTRQGSMAI